MTLSPIVMSPSKRGLLPQRINNLGLWLDASNSTSIILNGNGVSEWRDISGRGRHFHQTTALLQPNTNTRTYNGLKVIDFNGNQFLEGNTASLNLTSGLSSITIIIMAKFDNIIVGSGNANRLFTANNSLPTTARFTMYQFSGGVTLRHRDGDTNNDASSRDVIYNLENILFPNIFSGIVDLTSATASLYIGGTLRQTNGGWQGLSTIPNTNSSAVILGGIGPPFLQGLDGFIGEILVYRRALSDAERSQLEQYLIYKWNIQ